MRILERLRSAPIVRPLEARDFRLVGAALIGAVFMLVLLFVPGVRDPEREPSGPGPVPG